MSASYSLIYKMLSQWASNEHSILNFTVINVMEEANKKLKPGDMFEYDAVFRYLMRMDGFELIAKKMLYCPQGHKGKTFLLHEPVDDEHIFHCWCGEEYYFDPELTTIVFCFSVDFIQEAKCEKKTPADLTFTQSKEYSGHEKHLRELEDRGLINIFEKGVIYYVDKSIHVHGAVTGSNLNTGDHVVQSSETHNGPSDELFAKLLEFIKTLPEGSDKNEALQDVQALQQAVNNNNMDRAKKVWGILGDVVRTSASGISLAHFFGWI